ncbi:DUF4276 family protein [Chitinophaga sp. CF418]|uniref:DUF4276 family protein n=1 Tax=Chitinophaga sp. CF418 TaxID=1855287 RepID=UPI00091B92FD|nr:DUF4276 family protein [Chitinophaga sp. CF418]SHM81708.1 protein of unknown function [Chitinophaga sp. CF418]
MIRLNVTAEGFSEERFVSDILPQTAPSKRILDLCDSYDKIDDGILILKEIGLAKLRKECSHFNQWLTTLEQLK